MIDPYTSGRGPDAAALQLLLDRAVAGVPRWRRARVRRELAGYVEDAIADLVGEGTDARQALIAVSARFGDPELVAAGFRALPPARMTRGMQRTAAPLGVAVLGLVLGLALVQVRTPPGGGLQARDQGIVAVETASPAQLAELHVREVDTLRSVVESASTVPATVQIAGRLGLSRNSPLVLEPSVPALTPAWLPEGYEPARGALFLTSSATMQYFVDERGARSGIVVEVLRPDRSTVFQVKERHIFPVQVGALAGFYIDGEWEVRGPQDDQPAPASWRTDRSHSLLFARDGLLVLVAGPADAVDTETLLRIARSVR